MALAAGTSRVQASVDLVAVSSNVRRLAELAPAAEVMAVVKADAYGHGLLPASQAALDGGATWLGVATLAEASALRGAGFRVPVLALLLSPTDDVGLAITEGVDLPVGGVASLETVVRAARHVGRTARVHLEADTGMGRGGATEAQWPALVDAAGRAQAEGAVEVVGVWSHLACADVVGHPSVRDQLDRFRTALDRAERSGLRPAVRHLANSAATVRIPDSHYDLVRPGLSVYGISPALEMGSEAELGLVPAMTVRSWVASTKHVEADQGVSYGLEYRTPRPTELAVVPVGYADGLPRSGSGRVPLTIAGRRYPVAGRVCMDQVVVDVGADGVRAGDEVTLFGAGAGGEPTLGAWAAACGTIPNEVLTGLGRRVERTYLTAAATAR